MMTMTDRSVSVIMPVYNGEAFILEAIQSIRRQGHASLEIIVVDDGSSDRTAQIVAGAGDDIRYVHQDNRGAAAARNRGIEMATGAVIAFLDADDLWSASKLALQLPRLHADPSVEIVRGYTQRIHRNAHAYGEDLWEAFEKAWPALSLGSSIMRRSAFDKVGCLDATLALNEDVDWFVRAKESGIHSVLHEDIVQLYRRHEHNITNDRTLNADHFLRTLKSSIDRRRQAKESAGGGPGKV